MKPRLFIDRPIFACVVALCILLGGVLTLRALPLEQYPTVAPPSLTISATYPGADAATLEPNVTQAIEQDLTRVENLLYMASTRTSNGHRQRVVSGKSVSVSVDLEGVVIIKNQKINRKTQIQNK